MKHPMLLLAAGAAAIVAAPAAAAQDGKNRKVVIENASAQSIHNLYASPVTSKGWEEDLLGSGTIPAGTSQTANIDNGTSECVYDLKAVMADGKEHVRREVNVCASSRWVVSDSDNVLK